MKLHEAIAQKRVIEKTIEWMTPSSLPFIYKHYKFVIRFTYKGEHYVFFSDDLIDEGACRLWLRKMEANEVRTVSVDLKSVGRLPKKAQRRSVDIRKR